MLYGQPSDHRLCAANKEQKHQSSDALARCSPVYSTQQMIEKKFVGIGIFSMPHCQRPYTSQKMVAAYRISFDILGSVSLIVKCFSEYSYSGIVYISGKSPSNKVAGLL